MIDESQSIALKHVQFCVGQICEEPVCKFLACLEQHALVRELSSSTFYWVCAYANNQHCVEEDIKSNPRSTSFYRAMQMSEGVLLVSEGCLSYADADDPGYCRRGLLQFWLAAAADVAVATRHMAGVLWS